LRDRIVIGVDAPELIQEGSCCRSCGSKLWSRGIIL